MEAVLLLESGEMFRGRSFGATGETIGELVFNTSMTGYQEILADPSYRGQIVTMTYPLMGNYGVNDADFESATLHLAGFVVREACERPSSYRSTRTLGNLLKEKKIVGISEVDTRDITRALRDRGCAMAIISTEDTNAGTLMQRLKAAPPIEGRDLVREVATRRAYKFREKLDRSWYVHAGMKPPGKRIKHKIAVLDFGLKTNIARLLVAGGGDVTVFPPDTSAETILSKGFAGVLLSNGPGDPRALSYAVQTTEQLIGRLPVFGICLGHQLMGMALGCQIDKLKFGHHGANHPVKDCQSGKILITAQNHNYAVQAGSLDARVRVSHQNLNDGTIEGMEHTSVPAFSIQYHPEAAPGPHDALVHFAKFFDAMDERAGE